MTAVRMILLMTLLTGLLYPALVTAICQAVFPRQANGSLVERNGRVVGSRLIGQPFTRPEYFHGRPSAAGEGYDAALSGGSNLGMTSRKLVERVRASIDEFQKQNPEHRGPVPADMVTASGSGLDPHISPAAARAQAPRVARARGVSVEQVLLLTRQFTVESAVGVLGEPAVNVLELNLALDQDFPVRK